MPLHHRRRPGAAVSPPENAPPDSRPYAAPGGKVSRAPIFSVILMAVFLVGGGIGLLADWPAGPANLDWGVWVVLYGGYGFVIGAAIFHARTGR